MTGLHWTPRKHTRSDVSPMHAPVAGGIPRRARCEDSGDSWTITKRHKVQMKAAFAWISWPVNYSTMDTAQPCVYSFMRVEK